MDFRILGLSPQPFLGLYGRSDEVLREHNARRYVADEFPGFPDRIEVRDVVPGTPVILVNYEHQSGRTPFRATHAIFVREGADTAYDAVNEIPDALRRRPISLRAFDVDDWMIDADLCDGSDLPALIRRLFARPQTAYLHAHYAKRGCYAARVERIAP